jgi:hypothetical protein
VQIWADRHLGTRAMGRLHNAHSTAEVLRKSGSDRWTQLTDVDAEEPAEELEHTPNGKHHGQSDQ